MPLNSKDIKTNQPDTICDVCGRTLLRGERAESFLAAGARRQVCELCTNRATHEGWIRESGAAETLGARPARTDGRGRSLLGRLKSGFGDRRPPVPVSPETDPGLTPALEAELAAGHHPVVTERAARRSAAAADVVEPPRGREPRHVRAVPTNAELKMQRAIDVFNTSQHPRTVMGVARSLGEPQVNVRTLPSQPSVVAITVMWELSWYRYEVDLSDEAGGARRAAQGAELEELEADEQVVNATADERGTLHLLEDVG